MTRKIWITAALLLALNLPAWAQETALEQDLQGVIEAFLAENAMAPGVSAFAVCPALQLDWASAAGTVARGDQTALTAGHTFRIASNTKTYVAAALLRLVEQGKLGLDDSLGQHLTAEQVALLKGDGYDTEAITIAQVLAHTAGFADHTTDPRFEEIIFSEPDHKWTSAEQIRCLVEWCDPLGAPGKMFSYSDSGYVILGTIIERMTGLTLGPAVRQIVGFEDLGLRATHWEYMEPTPAAAGPRAHQYIGDHDVTGFYASFDLYGGGGIVTDAPELGLFMRRLLQGDVLARESTLAAMTERGTPTYRLGLMVMEFAGHTAYGHQGFWNTFAFHVPTLDLTVSGCILNHDAVNGRELAERLVAAVAGRQEKP
jgi:D-alanyl-D-alanine carboxypeptidase